MTLLAPRLSRHLRSASAALVLIALVSLHAAPGEPGSGKRLRVHPSFSDQVSAAGGRLIADYGSFHLYMVHALLPGWTNNPLIEAVESSGEILLNSEVLDTAKPEVAAMRLQPRQMAVRGKGSHLVQFAGPVKPEWRAQLETAGVRVVTYIPQNTYMVYGDADALSRVRSFARTAPYVQWDGDYHGRLKVHRAARSAVYKKGVLQDDPAPYAIQLVEDADQNALTLGLIDALKLQPVQRRDEVLNYVNVVVAIRPEDIDLIAAQPDVVSVHPYYQRKKFCERQAQILAGNLTGSVPSGPGYLAWLESKGFTQEQFAASGFSIDLTDSGIDTGTLNPNHAGLYLLGNTSLSSRVIYNRLEGFANAGSTLAGCDGHGTLNAHIAVGYDTRTGFPFADSQGFRYGLGVCPFVTVGSSVIFDPDYYTNPNFRNLQSRAYESGSRISNNSWGGGSSGAYDIDSQVFDLLVRDAQPSGAVFGRGGNQEMVIVVASGNEGPSLQSVGSPATAKNVITVGASEGVQAIGGTDSSGVSDTEANNANDIASFSSRGPCSDGRRKPDLVAPGTHISGGVYQRAGASGTGSAAICYNGVGVSGGVNSRYFPAGQQFFTASSGTSHAAPAVAGACALLRQHFINRSMQPPSPAMTKAYLMNSSRHATGSGANDTLWSDTQGMGRLNLARAFDDVPRIWRDQEPADLFTASGQTRTFTGTIAQNNTPFRVTLAWTDAPGTTAGNAYNNDLDLTVTVNGIAFKGNVFTGQYSASGRTADAKNNVESVFLPVGFSGNFTVQVTAANINSDGVPNNGRSLDQDFALVIYNGNLQTKAVLGQAGTTIAAESFAPNGSIDPGETVSVEFFLQNIGTASTSNLVATLESSGGVTAPSEPQAYGTLAPGGPPVSRPFTFFAAGDCGAPLKATLSLADGSVSLGSIAFDFSLGKLVTSNVFSETFDTVSPPALPTGWSAPASAANTKWIGISGTSDSGFNAAFITEPELPAVADLTSPAMFINSPMAQLSFRQRHNTEADDRDTTLGYDGGVLEIKIGNSAFSDILLAGGNFVTGGYSHTIDPATDSELAGRKAWAGDSGGYISTLVDLPAAAAGNNVQFRWRFGTDSGNFYLSGEGGWHIDTVSVTDGAYVCATAAIAPPTLLDFGFAQEQVTFSFQTTPGQSYAVEYINDLQQPDWRHLQTVAGDGSIITITNAISSPQRFYRVRSPAQP